MDPQQQVMQQQSTGLIPPYQFFQTSYNMMPLQQTAINRISTTSNTKNNTQNEPDTTTIYTWQQVKKRKISNQIPETKTVQNPILFNTQNRYEELSRLSGEDMETNEADETTTNTKYKRPGESKPPPIYIYIYIRSNKLL
jgi:hypothetical protein